MRSNVCIIGNSSQSFVSRDVMILGRGHNVEHIDMPRNVREWPKTISSLRRARKRNDVMICWFAGWHSTFAELLGGGVPVIVIVGGYDAANVPEIDYGAYRNIKERFATKYSLKRADWICLVDESLKDDVIRNAGVRTDNISTIPTGYDPDYFSPNGKKEELVITVGNVTAQVAKRKGYDHFIEAARSFPDVRFALIGKWKDNYIETLRASAPKNVHFTGFVSDDELLQWYRRAKVYCQLSRYEGLPNALCEAMLCECVPVGTRNCGIPTAIGDTGFYTEYGDIGSVVSAVGKALMVDEAAGRMARERIAERFSISARQIGLSNLIENVVKKSH